jgi:PTH2 family peptidyl-tRNA hydrolase
LLAHDMPPADEDHLFLYAVVPASLEMPVGKLGSQIGHAYQKGFAAAQKTHPQLAERYCDPAHGGSIALLEAKNQKELILAFAKARAAGLPCYLMVDKHHILPPHFTGLPIISALGIGPCTKAQARPITKKFRCL